MFVIKIWRILEIKHHHKSLLHVTMEVKTVFYLHDVTGGGEGRAKDICSNIQCTHKLRASQAN